MPAPSELEAHAKLLEAIARDAKGAALWTRLEAQDAA
jgi:hypothetical protein